MSDFHFESLHLSISLKDLSAFLLGAMSSDQFWMCINRQRQLFRGLLSRAKLSALRILNGFKDQNFSYLLVHIDLFHLKNLYELNLQMIKNLGQIIYFCRKFLQYDLLHFSKWVHLTANDFWCHECFPSSYTHEVRKYHGNLFHWCKVKSEYQAQFNHPDLLHSL